MITRLLILFSVISLTLPWPSRATQTMMEPPTVTVEHPVHFLTADGSDVVIQPGSYLLEAAQEWLRVYPRDPKDALLLAAQWATHSEEVSQPTPLSIASEGDAHYLVLMLPGEKSLEATGSYSGVRSRAVQQVSPTIRQRAYQMAKQGQPAQGLTAPPPGPAPNVTSWIPSHKILAGDVVTFHIQDLRPFDFMAQLGNSPGLPLPVIALNANSIQVRIPEQVVTNGSPLIVRYKNSQAKTLEPSYQIIAKPQVESIQILDGPWIGAPSTIRVTLGNLTPPLANAELSLISPACWTQGQKKSLPPSGGSAIIDFPITFRPSGVVADLPGNTDTERLAALSGKTCPLELSFWSPNLGHFPSGHSVTLPQVSIYTITNTWDLTTHTTPSNNKFGGTVSPPIGCLPTSIGKAGSFPIGVVNADGDFSFQLRNGALPVECHYETTQPLETKPGWVISELDWHFSGDTSCHLSGANTVQFEWSPNHWGVNAFHDATRLYRMKFNAACEVTPNDPTNNNHVFSATLRSINLVGPRNQTWRNAFK
ncbi:MAG: hypothetical protein OEY80_10945 [Nitrospirota bacterium]|nr:hypothetical protein [Nitrospirota bacterium]